MTLADVKLVCRVRPKARPGYHAGREAGQARGCCPTPGDRTRLTLTNDSSAAPKARGGQEPGMPSVKIRRSATGLLAE
jgi:hypothetical protein